MKKEVKKEVKKVQEPVVPKEDYKSIAVDILATICKRRKNRNTFPFIESVNIEIDDNMTLAIIVDQNGDYYVGWSKFNPADVNVRIVAKTQVTKTRDKKKTKVKRWWGAEKESRYNKEAGIKRAISRAVLKIVGPVPKLKTAGSNERK